MKKQNSKIFSRDMLAMGGLIAFALLFFNTLFFNTLSVASAAPFIPLEGEGYGIFPLPEGEGGLDIAKGLVARLADNVRYIVGAIAVLLIVVSAIKLITAQGNEEVFQKQMQNILWGVVGLAIIGLAGELARILSVQNGGFLRDPAATLKSVRIFNNAVEIVIVFIKYIVGGLAVLIMVRSGMTLITRAGKDEDIAAAKKNLGASIIGLILILVASPIINDVFYNIDETKFPGLETVRPGVDVARGLREIVGVTNLLVSIVGPLAVASLIGGAILYIAAGGEDDKVARAKRIILWSLVGLIIIYGAFGIVSTFVAGRFEGI